MSSYLLHRSPRNGLALAAAVVVGLPIATYVQRVHGASADDLVTGGGWIDGTPTGARAAFRVKGGVGSAGAFGRLDYVDCEDDTHLEAESITSYVVIDATTRRIDGTARIDGAAGLTFSVTVSDAGEPGVADLFALTLSNGYTASGTLQRGNIRLHVD